MTTGRPADESPTTRRLAIGRLIGVAFGSLWCAYAAVAAPAAWRNALFGAAAVVGLALAAWILVRGRNESPGMFARRAYVVAVIAEVVALAAAPAVLRRIGHPDWFTQAMGVIVGLHFLGLWRASGQARFVWITLGTCLVSLAAFLAPVTAAGAPAGLDLRDFATSLGEAGVLWTAAAWIAPARR